MNEGLKRVKARKVVMRLVKIVASAFRLGREILFLTSGENNVHVQSLERRSHKVVAQAYNQGGMLRLSPNSIPC